MTGLLKKCLEEWNCKIEYACNCEASQQKRILKERSEGGVTIALRGDEGRYFVEEYRGRTMYPSTYKVHYEEDAIKEITEEEYLRWRKEKLK